MITCEKCGTTQNEDHPICVHVAARRGGRKTAEKGHDYFVKIGKLGGLAVVAKLGREHLRRIGERGGAVTRAKGEAHFAEIGRKGGQAVKVSFSHLMHGEDE